MVNRSWLIYSDFLILEVEFEDEPWAIWTNTYYFHICLIQYHLWLEAKKKMLLQSFIIAAFQFNIYIKNYIHTIICWKKSNSNLNLMRKWMLYVKYVTSQNMCYITLVNCMIFFTCLLYLILYLFFKYVTYTYSQCWDKLSIS